MRKPLRYSVQRVSLATILLLLSSVAILAQSYKPAIEYQSLMNMCYYENNGGFLVEDLQLR